MRPALLCTAALLALSPVPAAAQRGDARGVPSVPSLPQRVEPIRPDLIERLEAQRQAQREAEALGASRAVPRDLSREEWRETREIARRAAAEDQAVMERTYERDPAGFWRRRDEIIVATAEPGLMTAAAALGLMVQSGRDLPSAGLTLYTFAVSPTADGDRVFAALRAARPNDAIDLNPVYEFQAVGSAPASAPPPAPPPGAGKAAGRRVAAMIDSGLPGHAPALPGVSLRVARFGPGAGQPNAHALAVAQVLAQTAGPDALTLLAADVSEAGPLSGASAASIAEALDWAAGAGARVVNISMTGPANAVLAAVVKRIAARGVVIVAAAGNGGPRASAPYPAALPEVVAVTAVDDKLKIWRRATQGPHVYFAAKGVKIAAAGTEWTGTSLAAPVVAGVLLRSEMTPEALQQEARDLGAPGRDPVFGFGFVGKP